MPYSLWCDHLTPNVSLIPLCPHHMLPTPTTFIFAHVTSVLGTAEQSSCCHGSWWREPAHWLLGEEEEKAHSVRGRVPSACLPLFSVSCWLGHINRACCSGQRPAGTARHSCVHRQVEGGAPRSMSLVSPSSVKCVKDKSRAGKKKVGCLFLHLELLLFFRSVWI